MLDRIGGRLLVMGRMDGRIEPADAILQPHRAGDQLAQRLRQQRKRRLVPRIAGRELDLGLLAARLGERHLALVHGAVQQQPGGELHQPGGQPHALGRIGERGAADRKSTRLNSSHGYISYAVFCLKKKKKTIIAYYSDKKKKKKKNRKI